MEAVLESVIFFISAVTGTWRPRVSYLGQIEDFNDGVVWGEGGDYSYLQ